MKAKKNKENWLNHGVGDFMLILEVNERVSLSYVDHNVIESLVIRGVSSLSSWIEYIILTM